MNRLHILLLGIGIFFAPNPLFSQNIDTVKQGFSIRLRLDNRGVMGRQAYRGTIPRDSLGLEYPIGSNIEHIFGGGVWIGGLLDTSATGTAPPLKLVSTGYQGWTAAGQLFEMFPGGSAADTFWRATQNDSIKPPGWDQYWGGNFPFNPISDQDLYCMYTDYQRPVIDHIPMNLKVIQSSYAWNDPYADAIIIIEYRIINMGTKLIDSAYIGFFFEADVGPTNVSSYFVNNFSDYIPNSRTGYTHNPVDAGSTPVGAALLWPPIDQRGLRYTFRWYPGQQSPTPDAARYNFMSSGIIDSSEFPQLSDTRFNFAFGPFFIKPITDPTHDTLLIAAAIVSGFSRRIDHRIVLQNNAARATDIYLNQGIRLPATPPSPPLRVNVGFRRVELDWQWRLGDDALYGRPNPEANWDTTNQVARRDPRRYSAPHPIGTPPNIDTTLGGRNFEAFRIWRSEHPLFPDASFTLLKQFDVPADSFEFDTGLQYTFVDSNLVRGKTYVYSVTSLSIPNLAYQTIQFAGSTFVVEVPVDPLESGKRVNATRIDLPFSVSDQPDKVMVVPNPYRTDRDYTLESGGYEGPFGNWDENQRLIKFINLPEVCTIRIFSLSGDLIRTVEHDGRSATGISRGDRNVPLVSESNRALASGIYIFTVESNLGVQTGKFVIIR